MRKPVLHQSNYGFAMNKPTDAHDVETMRALLLCESSQLYAG